MTENRVTCFCVKRYKHRILVWTTVWMTCFIVGNLHAKNLGPFYFTQQVGGTGTCWAAGLTTLADYYSYPFRNKITQEWTYYGNVDLDEGTANCSDSWLETRLVPDTDGINTIEELNSCGTRFCSVIDDAIVSPDTCCDGDTGSCDVSDNPGLHILKFTGMLYGNVDFHCQNAVTCEIDIAKIQNEIDHRRIILIDYPDQLMVGHVNIVYGYKYINGDFYVYIYDTDGSFGLLEIKDYVWRALQGGYMKSTYWYFVNNCYDSSLTVYPTGTNAHSVKACYISASYTIPSNKSSIFEARHAIQLKPGFHALGSFHATVNPVLDMGSLGDSAD